MVVICGTRRFSCVGGDSGWQPCRSLYLGRASWCARRACYVDAPMVSCPACTPGSQLSPYTSGEERGRTYRHSTRRIDNAPFCRRPSYKHTTQACVCCHVEEATRGRVHGYGSASSLPHMCAKVGRIWADDESSTVGMVLRENALPTYVQNPPPARTLLFFEERMSVTAHHGIQRFDRCERWLDVDTHFVDVESSPRCACLT